MYINRTINNNVISAYDNDGFEVVIMGKGIGFHTKPGDPVAMDKIEKTFRMDSLQEVDRFKTLLSQLPIEHLDIASDIIAYANEKLGKKMNQSIYITLTDHIHFVIERYREHMIFDNPLFAEIKRFYYPEYAIGRYALDLIKEQIGIRLPDQEAASIAIHLVNAEYNTQIRDVMDILHMIQEILDKVRLSFGLHYDEDSLDYDRFVSHLKYLGQRLFHEDMPDIPADRSLCDFVKKRYERFYQCSDELNDLIVDKYEKSMTENEKLYLTLHLKRLADSLREP